MKKYVLLVDGEYSEYSSKIVAGDILANMLKIEYSENMEVPAEWVELVEENFPALTKYQTITSAITDVDGVLTRTYAVSEGTPERIFEVDNQISKFMRKKRDALLSQCDWTQLPDAQLTEEKKTEWVNYRQALRDITDDALFPTYNQWPTAPQ
jgi:hypothetical protein